MTALRKSRITTHDANNSLSISSKKHANQYPDNRFSRTQGNKEKQTNIRRNKHTKQLKSARHTSALLQKWTFKKCTHNLINKWE